LGALNGGCFPVLVASSLFLSYLLTRVCSPVIPLQFMHSLKTVGGDENIRSVFKNMCMPLGTQWGC